MSATASYERINYALRPAKNIERKMIADALRRLRSFAPLKEYRYVGFGSTYFSDFNVFHKALGIRQMTSIEKDDVNRRRFEFNRPFGCIDMAFGLSTDVLPGLDWERESIVWLDYDGSLDRTTLADIAFVTAEAKPGSVFMLTVNAHPARYDNVPNRLEKLRQDVGPENVPATVRVQADLAGWKLARVCRQIVDNMIATTLRDRNAGLGADEQVHFRQLFNFHYQDGAKMLTVGGVFYRADQAKTLAACAFDDFEYVSETRTPYRIEVPNLTFREMRHLNEQLPAAGAAPAAPGVPNEDSLKYEKVYRYFPAFVDAEI